MVLNQITIYAQNKKRGAGQADGGWNRGLEAGREKRPPKRLICLRGAAVS
jgi:hypothetical protein